MKMILLGLLISLPAHASTSAKFMGLVGMVTLSDYNGSDTDPTVLFDKMNVPEKTNPGARVKSVQSADKIFTLMCTLRDQGQTCSVVVRAGSRGTISPATKVIRFVAQGDDAKKLFQLFTPTDEDGFSFVSSDRFFSIRAQEELFIAEFNGN